MEGKGTIFSWGLPLQSDLCKTLQRAKMETDRRSGEKEGKSKTSCLKTVFNLYKKS